MSVLSETNINKICRTCVSTSASLHPLFQAALKPTRCFENDGLPTQICSKCIIALLRFEKFHQECHDSNTIFRNQVHQPVNIITNEALDAPSCTTIETSDPQTTIDDLITNGDLLPYINKSRDSQESLSDLPTIKVFTEYTIVTKEPLENTRALAAILCPVHNRTCAVAYSCQVCGKEFEFESNYIAHLTQYSRVKRHVCSVCNRGFDKKQQLTNHLNRRPRDVERFLCAACGNLSREQHAKRMRMRTRVEEFPCTRCSNTYHNRKDYDDHVRKHAHSCSMCNSALNETYQSLKRVCAWM